MAKCKDCKCELPMHRAGCPEAKGEIALYAKIEQLQTEIKRLEGLLRQAMDVIATLQKEK